MPYQALYQILNEANAQAWVKRLPAQIEQALQFNQHSDLARWQKVLEQLPVATKINCDFTGAVVKFGQAQDSTLTTEKLKSLLMQLHPWRKGPYQIYGVPIDTEWRSDYKWLRLQNHIAPLTNRLVLDVGCGNGYHCWRILGAGARAVIGIDPTLISIMQFQVCQRLAGNANVFVLPLGIEAIPQGLKAFDTVFSMGVLYHRRSPIDHLIALRNSLRSGGELVLETLIIDGKLGDTLVPQQRYATMRNVWFIPSCETLIAWLQRCGFGKIRLVDVTTTSSQEQRTTAWMKFHSLADFLDPENPELTIEGLPAPRRAIIVANTR